MKNSYRVKYRWISTFHKTTAVSTLSEQDVDDIEIQYNQGYITSKDKDYRKLKALRDKMCIFKMSGCACRSAMRIERQLEPLNRAGGGIHSRVLSLGLVLGFW